MPDILVEWMDCIGLGTAIVCFIGICGLIGALGAFLFKVMSKYNDRIREDVLSEQSSENIHKTVNEMNETIGSLTKEIKTLSTGVENLTIIVQSHDDSLRKMDGNLEHITGKIAILIESDISSFESYIIDQYNHVKTSERIDILSLQKIEKVYMNYRQEMGDKEDETVEKIMSEIRKLPIK